MFRFIYIRAVFYVAGDENNLCPGGRREKLPGQSNAVVLAQLDVQQSDVGRCFLCRRLQGVDRMKHADLARAGEHLLHLGAQAGRKERVIIADINGIHVELRPFLGM